MARRALPDLGAHRRRGRVRGRPHRPRRARALRLRHRSSTTTTSSRAAEQGLVEAEVQAARELGCPPRRLARLDGSRRVAGRPAARLGRRGRSTRFSPTRERLAGAARVADRGARVQLAVAPCSPFSVTGDLMTESATLARELGLQLHTHLAETVEEEAYCRERFGCSPVEYLDGLGWLDGDVWCAHCVHLSEPEIAALRRDRHRRRALPDVEPAARSGDRARARDARRGRARRPGRRRLRLERAQRSLLRRQAGAARRARARRADGPDSREALRIATRGGAEVLARDDIGVIAPGTCADLAVWSTRRPRARRRGGSRRRLVFSAPHRVDRLYVGGELVVDGGALVRADEARDRPPPSGAGAKIRSRDLALDPCARHGRGTAGRGRRGDASTAMTTSSPNDERTGTGAHVSQTSSSPACIASPSSLRRRSSAASSSRSSSRTATTTSRSSSLPTGARATAAADRRRAG